MGALWDCDVGMSITVALLGTEGAWPGRAAPVAVRLADDGTTAMATVPRPAGEGMHPVPAAL